MTDTQAREDHAEGGGIKPPECDATDGNWVCTLDANHDIYGYPKHVAIELREERRWSISHYKWMVIPTGSVHRWET